MKRMRKMRTPQYLTSNTGKTCFPACWRPVESWSAAAWGVKDLEAVLCEGLCICLLIVCTIAPDESSSLSRHTPIFRFFRFLRRGCPRAAGYPIPEDPWAWVLCDPGCEEDSMAAAGKRGPLGRPC
ncbi:family with sequence similarity 174 member B [Rhinolophus ferrumequinum]|uniref:Family with sequence similarity 174 member B n=1 Tax=Rhinolophus ferrumequinum TaxID=59479 RepID=A0A7J7RAM3_RHIFE|nr:family with sequence similarity 174 member B [Rhinolophus ferrumequinum]